MPEPQRTHPDLVIRSARVTDLAGIDALERTCFPEHLRVSTMSMSMRQAVDLRPSLVIVGTCDGAVTGYCMGDLGETPCVGLLAHMAVLPAMRGRGIAACLLERVLAQFATQCRTEVVLTVAPDNTAARALYERFGFRTQGPPRGYFRDGDTYLARYLMVRTAPERAPDLRRSCRAGVPSNGLTP